MKFFLHFLFFFIQLESFADIQPFKITLNSFEGIIKTKNMSLTNAKSQIVCQIRSKRKMIKSKPVIARFFLNQDENLSHQIIISNPLVISTNLLSIEQIEKCYLSFFQIKGEEIGKQVSLHEKSSTFSIPIKIALENEIKENIHLFLSQNLLTLITFSRSNGQILSYVDSIWKKL